MKKIEWSITNEKGYESKQNDIVRHNYFIDENFELEIDLTSYTNKEDDTKTIDDLKLIDNFAKRFQCEYIIDVGCTNIDNLINLKSEYKIIGINLDSSKNIVKDDSIYYINCSLSKTNKINMPKEILQKSIILCSNVLENINNQSYLLSNIKDFMEYSKIGLISTLDRLITNSEEAKWTMSEFKKNLEFFNFNLHFAGLTTNNSYIKDNIICILGNNNLFANLKEADNFRVVAFLPVYNEEDILYNSVIKLFNSGVEVYIIENWSTDSSFKIVEKLYEENKIIGYERFPKERLPLYGNWKEILNRIETLSKEIKANWFILKGVDEIIESPWEKINLKEGIQIVDKMGYNAINHTLMNYKPVDNGFIEGDFENYFKYFNFHEGKIKLIRTWKNIENIVSIASNAGHDINFKDRKISPFNFLIKHYTIRSQMHGMKKMINDRQKRWDPEESKYWHKHYKRFNQKSNFLGNPKSLLLYNENIFNEYYLLERVLGKYEYNKCMKSIEV